MLKKNSIIGLLFSVIALIVLVVVGYFGGGLIYDVYFFPEYTFMEAVRLIAYESFIIIGKSLLFSITFMLVFGNVIRGVLKKESK